MTSSKHPHEHKTLYLKNFLLYPDVDQQRINSLFDDKRRYQSEIDFISLEIAYNDVNNRCNSHNFSVLDYMRESKHKAVAKLRPLLQTKLYNRAVSRMSYDQLLKEKERFLNVHDFYANNW